MSSVLADCSDEGRYILSVISFSDGTGFITRHADWSSQDVTPRPVDVWCPPEYATAAARYPVIYMHDGKWLFDSALLDGGVDWGIDEAMTRLIKDKHVPGAIVVGIWSSPQRARDYMPQKPLETPEGQTLLERFRTNEGGDPASDRYLQFLVKEVKPFIDQTYRTLPDQPHTSVMGSSMGGLISLYALVEYPEIFGGAGCLSTHWPIGENLLVDYLGRALPPAGRHRLYFDFGTAGLDAAYEPFQQRMDTFVRAAGYAHGRDWLTRKFEGGEHTEAAWRDRVHLPLGLLLMG
jgi:predicted alpha/beta superfamily hydrolase